MLLHGTAACASRSRSRHRIGSIIAARTSTLCDGWYLEKHDGWWILLVAGAIMRGIHRVCDISENSGSRGMLRGSSAVKWSQRQRAHQA